MTEREHKSLMRNLGAFVGHVARGLFADVDEKKGVRKEVKREVSEEVRETEVGRVKLRRTVVEEMEIEPRREEGEAGEGRGA